MSHGGTVRLWDSLLGGRRSSRGLAAVLLVSCLALLPGCTFIRVARELGRSAERGPSLSVAAYEVGAPQPRERFSVGVASEDITPPPGFPTGGHSSEGSLPRGQWMRLRARAFFFEDRAGHTLALVSCELFAIPGGLHAQVAERVAKEAARRKLAVAFPPESLVLAATHTHHSPGNYMTARGHNQFGSTYSGFSRPLFDFLVERISNAVLAALMDARRHPEGVELSVHVRAVDYELVRNRAPLTFMVNRDRDALLAALNGSGPQPSSCEPKPGEPAFGWEVPECPRLRAADRTLTVVELRRVSGEHRERVGALVFFAVHPTVLSPGAPLYNSDFVGYAMESLERRWATAGGQPVVGFFNGAEGDITARRNQHARDMRSTRDFGERLAQAVVATRDSAAVATEREPALSVRGVLVRTGEAEGRRCTDSRRDTWTLSDRPMLGAAALGGAEDDYTVLHLMGWREGIVDRPTYGQGMKLPALDSKVVRALRFSDEFAPPEIFPDTLPLTLVSIGGFTLATLPGEVSTAQGQAIRNALGQQPHGRLELVGLANEYISYCSSPDEYSVQDYMGAFTIWGPQEGPYLACRLSKLSTQEVLPVPRKAERRVFWPGPKPEEAFGPVFTGDSILRPDEGLHEILRDAKGFPVRRLPWFPWSGPTGMCGRRLCPEARGRVSIWERTPEGWRALELPEQGLEDDLGAGFVTVLLDKQGRWASLWLRPLFQPRPGTYAFVVEREGGSRSCSRPFTLGTELPAPEAAEIGEGTCDARGAPTDGAP